jgi:acetolactate synthase-like protein
MNGGDWVAEVLRAQGVELVFTLAGGHISPILVGCNQRGIRVIDTRHEATAVFAADAVARLTGVPGVAVVTAGPGVTNTVTAVKNAQMAQSPVVLMGGAAATILKGRGALQDIEQIALFSSVVKWSTAVRRVKDIVPALEKAFYQAQSGVPGPVFVELPIDVLYGEDVVRSLYGIRPDAPGMGQKLLNRYLAFHLNRLFAGADQMRVGGRIRPEVPRPSPAQVRRAADKLGQAERPVLLVGSQAMLQVDAVQEVAAGVEKIGAPVYLSGMARGLMGRNHPLQMRHKRREALKEADLVILAGVPCDFRLNYGRGINRRATFISANRSRIDLTLNRKPDIGILGDPGAFLCRLADQLSAGNGWPAWQASLRERDDARTAEIGQQARQPTGRINPLHLCQEIESILPADSILIADGGDFVATASYIVSPPGPLTWLDPGPFGTLGVGAGFALGAGLVRPGASIWILFGDGSLGYSLAEFDTFVRHKVPVTAVVGNDAGWTQIARDQITLLGDDVSTVLADSNYQQAVAGLGGQGWRLEDPELIPEVLAEARDAAATGRPVLVNAILGKTDFRQGSISI